MSIIVSKYIKKFSGKYLKKLGKRKITLIEIYMASLFHTHGKITLSALSRNVVLEQRFKTTVGKFFGRDGFRSREQYRSILQHEINRVLLTHRNEGKWFLAIDPTSTKRGGFTKIENALQYKDKYNTKLREPKKSQKKSKKNSGRSTKAHTFVIAILIAPDGTRIPFTRYTYYTKEYCKNHKKKYLKQTELALMMIKELRKYLPDAIQPIVLADNAFDCNKIFQYCKSKNIAFITVANSNRVYLYSKKQTITKNLLSRGQNKNRANYQSFRYVKGQEPLTRLHNRYANENQKKKIQHSYSVMGEILEFSNLGELNVVFSYKHRKMKKDSFCILLCSELSFTAEEIVEFYALRWQVEIFFRELKSELGLGDYSGQDFKSYERYIDFLLISYLFLEYYRRVKIEHENSRKEIGKFKNMRTRSLISQFRKDSMIESFDYLRNNIGSDFYKNVAA
ncbi:MAG: transposase [Spirochaetota bacterium]